LASLVGNEKSLKIEGYWLVLTEGESLDKGISPTEECILEGIKEGVCKGTDEGILEDLADGVTVVVSEGVLLGTLDWSIDGI